MTTTEMGNVYVIHISNDALYVQGISSNGHPLLQQDAVPVQTARPKLILINHDDDLPDLLFTSIPNVICPFKDVKPQRAQGFFIKNTRVWLTS